MTINNNFILQRTDKIETEIEFGRVRIISGSSGSVISLLLTLLCH